MNDSDRQAHFVAALEGPQVGDILLMRARGPMASLVAWFGDTLYSHVALVGRAGYLIESGPKGIAELSLHDRIDDIARWQFIDASRPLTYDQRPLVETDRIAVLAHALSLRRTPLATNDLFAVGMLAALRDRPIPDSHRPLRWLLREAMAHIAHEGASGMMGSEFVYRCFAENPAQPKGRLAPKIELPTPAPLPLPALDWDVLWRELLPQMRPQRRQALKLTSPEDVRRGFPDEDVSNDLLIKLTAAARTRLGLMSFGNGLLGVGDRGVRNANPRLVRPRDLQESPSQLPLGRLMEASDVDG